MRRIPHAGGRLKTLDRQYLATHPAGNEQAEFLMHLPLPDGVDVGNNQDGPRVTLKATANTYRTMPAVLGELHVQDSGGIAMPMVFNAAGEEIGILGSLAAAAPLIRQLMHKVTVPFHTFRWPPASSSPEQMNTWGPRDNPSPAVKGNPATDRDRAPPSARSGLRVWCGSGSQGVQLRTPQTQSIAVTA
ncbi:hypothetical protein LVY72_14745 [Arthrobacter sp. I2-34]|uniref:Uncharacterized protein n=1 Tax=Arthrobacter hankyongi TaxID=2904801 RepID=A0ABS9L903_9MICC|nr:hypothetical protein [Arthrobacter hankyongi]MCG2623154.1 hypothetical protein [Arthrobacter hankyongi]